MAAALATVTRLHEATEPQVLSARSPTEPWGAVAACAPAEPRLLLAREPTEPPSLWACPPREPLFLVACEPKEPWGASPPEPVRLDPLTVEELARIRDGECEADLYERGLVWAARVRSAIDVRLAEGLHLLRKGGRLAELGFRLDDFVREVLDLGEHAGTNLAKLGRELRERPLLQAAMEAGRVRLRAAQTVARVAVGDAEAFWVERAAHQPVRELEELVRRAGGEPPEPDEDWLRLRTHLPPEERLVVDAALNCARLVLPGSNRGSSGRPSRRSSSVGSRWTTGKGTRRSSDPASGR